MSYGFIVEKGWIIRTYRNLDSLSNQVAEGMSAKVTGVAQNHVAKRTSFDTNISLLKFIDKVRE